MTPAAARAAIETRIASLWAAGPNTAIAWPNVPFTPPATARWLKVDFLWGSGGTLTKAVNRVVGVLQLAVFGPKDLGDGALDGDAESARAMVNKVRLASPNDEAMFGPASGPVRQQEESWRSLVISAPFQVHETVP